MIGGRRSILAVVHAAVLCTCCAALASCGGGDDDDDGDSSAPTQAHLYVGCRDDVGSVQHYLIEAPSGTLTPVDTAAATSPTTFFTVNASQSLVYVGHSAEGRITTFTRDLATGSLTPIGSVTVPGNKEGDADAQPPYNVDCLNADDPTAPANPAIQTLTLSPDEGCMIVSNWCANTVLVYAMNADGTVGNLLQTLIDGEKSHHAVFDSTGRYVLVPYLASNAIAVYLYDAATHLLSPGTPLLTVLPADNGPSGPRHLAFHPTQTSWLYSINETAGSISFFLFDSATGTLAHQQTISSLPADSPYTAAELHRHAAEIRIDQTGRFLYVSNRLDQAADGSIGAYSIAQDTGALTPIEWESTGGATPRLFSLSPDGRLLVVTNRHSDNMSVFSVNQETGELDLLQTLGVCTTPVFANMIPAG